MTAEEAKTYGLIDDVVTRPPENTNDKKSDDGDQSSNTELKLIE